MSSDVPDYTAILDDLFIGNLASAKTLHEHPELGITHVLSVCPDYPEAAAVRKGAAVAESAPGPTVWHPEHRCVSVEDSEYEDILSHLPSAIGFIRKALGSQRALSIKSGGQETRLKALHCKHQAELTSQEESAASSSQQKNKVLVHCVMGVSRSTTVVCAYLMATCRVSFSTALTYIRRRRPRVHPNYGFRRQLQIFGECGYFEDYPAPIPSHPAYANWQRKKKREINRYLSRFEDMVDVKSADETSADITLSDDFPTDQLEASSLLSEVGATHFLTISPASLPPPLTPPPSAAAKSRRPSGLLSPVMSPMSSPGSTPDSINPSPLSSRSSSFSNGSRLSGFSPLSSPSTAATSVLSLPSLLPPSKLRSEISSSDSDEESENDNEDFVEPDYLTVAGVEHHHIDVKNSDPSGLLFHLSEAVCFIQQALDNDKGSESEQDLNPKNDIVKDDRRKHILIHCSTESRACAVVCAYLMSCKELKPTEAYSVLEKAQPLFNPTKSFVSLLELFHDCDFNPTLDHPRVRTWLYGATKKSSPPWSTSTSITSLPFASDSPAKLHPGQEQAAHWKIESDNEGDYSISLLRRLGTPMRCGSFSNAYLQQQQEDDGANGNINAAVYNEMPSGVTHHSAGRDPEGVDVEKLLQRSQGVGDPDFAFDVEAFRGALRGIAAENEKKSNRAGGR